MARIATLIGLAIIATPTSANVPWRTAAARVRTRNSRAQREGRSERYVVDSPNLLAGVMRGDRIAWANEAFAAALGYESPTALCGVSVWDFVAPECHTLAKRRISQLAALQVHPKRVRYAFCGPNGKRIEVRLCTVDTWADGGEMCRHFVGSEVGEAKATLVPAATRYESILIVRPSGFIPRNLDDCPDSIGSPLDRLEWPDFDSAERHCRRIAKAVLPTNLWVVVRAIPTAKRQSQPSLNPLLHRFQS